MLQILLNPVVQCEKEMPVRSLYSNMSIVRDEQDPARTARIVTIYNIRLCKGKGKGTVHPRTGLEGPEGE